MIKSIDEEKKKDKNIEMNDNCMYPTIAQKKHRHVSFVDQNDAPSSSEKRTPPTEKMREKERKEEKRREEERRNEEHKTWWSGRRMDRSTHSVTHTQTRTTHTRTHTHTHL